MSDLDVGKHFAPMFDIAGAAQKAFAGTGSRSRGRNFASSKAGAKGAIVGTADAQVDLVKALKKEGLKVTRQGMGDQRKGIPPSLEVNADVDDLNAWIARSGVSEHIYAVDLARNGKAVIVPKVTLRGPGWSMDDAQTQMANAGAQALSVEQGITPEADARPNISVIDEMQEPNIDMNSLADNLDQSVNEATAL